MSKEVVRHLFLALGCAILFVLLGFSPLMFAASSMWAANGVSAAAMPVGESGPSEVHGPLKIAKQPTVVGDPAMHP